MESSENAVVEYAYKPSLFGSALVVRLERDGLQWQSGRQSGRWNYRDIGTIRLSYRPSSLQAKQYRADLWSPSKGRLRVASGSRQTIALMAPQDAGYRHFTDVLHHRLASAKAKPTLLAGLSPLAWWLAMLAFSLVMIAITGLAVQALATQAWAALLFLAGFVALFCWQIGWFLYLNRPRSYTLDAVPEDVLPRSGEAKAGGLSQPG